MLLEIAIENCCLIGPGPLQLSEFLGLQRKVSLFTFRVIILLGG